MCPLLFLPSSQATRHGAHVIPGVQYVSIHLGVSIGPHAHTDTLDLQGPLNMTSARLSVSGQGIGTSCVHGRADSV